MSGDPLEGLPRPTLEPGSVALVGGGPGALDLVTVRGLLLLHQADVVVVDRLGPAGLTGLLGEDVEIIEVGKVPGKHSTPQREIEQILVEQARAGKRVVRLKGGDAFVLGRGGEEVLACRAAGIPVEVVPGVTSAIAAPTAGDVPVTHRGTAVAMHVVNAHGDLGQADLAALRDPGTTTVLMMGVEWLPRLTKQAILNGVDPATPVAVVQNATLPEQRELHTTLGRAPEAVEQAHMGFPAVITLGRTSAEGFLVPPEPARPAHGSGREAVEPAPSKTTTIEPAGASAPQPGVHDAQRPALVICAHGTRSRTGRDVVRAIMTRAAGLLPDVAVREAYVDVQEPRVRSVVELLAEPVAVARTRPEDLPEAVVVPLLLATGYHVRHDIGGAIAGRGAVAAPPLGPDSRIARILAQRLAEAGLSDDDAVVLAAAGTRDAEGAEQARTLSEQLSSLLARPVRTAYVAAASPSVSEAVSEERAARLDSRGRVVVASALLIPGHFQSLLDEAGADVVTAPIGDHPLIAEIVAERYAAAVGE